jgi:hypothetical protein
MPSTHQTVPVPVETRNGKGQFARQSSPASTPTRQASVRTVGRTMKRKTRSGAKVGKNSGRELELHRSSTKRRTSSAETTTVVGSHANMGSATNAHRRAPSPGALTDELFLRDYRRTRDKLKVRGLATIDKRGAAARSLIRWRKALVADLGGGLALTTGQLTLVDMASRTRLLVDHVDAFLLAQTSLIHVGKKKLMPLVLERTKLADSLVRQLATLGLERKVKQVPALQQYVQAKYAASEAEPGESGGA